MNAKIIQKHCDYRVTEVMMGYGTGTAMLFKFKDDETEGKCFISCEWIIFDHESSCSSYDADSDRLWYIENILIDSSIKYVSSCDNVMNVRFDKDGYKFRITALCASDGETAFFKDASGEEMGIGFDL